MSGDSCVVGVLGAGLILICVAIVVLKNELSTVLGGIVLVFVILALFNVVVNKTVRDVNGIVVKLKAKLRWDTLLKFMFATMDLATDSLFMLEMHGDPTTLDIFWVSIGFFIFSTVCCGVAVFKTLKQLSKSKHAAATGDTFEIWARNNAVLVGLVSIISFTRNDALAFLFSNFRVPFLNPMNAPVDMEWQAKIEELGLVAVATEDVPQLSTQIWAILRTAQASTGTFARE
jgi:hypothetical protein